MQALLDAFGDASRQTRANYHLTLGKAIKQLEEFAADVHVLFDWNGMAPAREHSYRGYYADLSLSWHGEDTTVRELRDLLKKALGATYEGYKGGDFVMDEDTPLWAASWGDTGRAIVGMQFNGKAVFLQTKEMD